MNEKIRKHVVHMFHVSDHSKETAGLWHFQAAAQNSTGKDSYKASIKEQCNVTSLRTKWQH